jgi:phosphatidylserine decarboxylase
MTIHKEGYKTIALTTAFIFVLNYIVVRYFHNNQIVIFGSYALSVFLFITVLQFFRSPNRKPDLNEQHILSPADGKVVVIEEVEEKEYFKGKRLQVSIFMSPKNVHINWTPISGLVKYVKYHPGLHLVAWHPKASSDNEMTTLVIQSPVNNTEILIRQIAGALARRIKYYLKEGETVAQGKQLGFIKFGSRVDLLLPLDVKLNVTLGQKVKGSKTVIAEFGNAIAS